MKTNETIKTAIISLARKYQYNIVRGREICPTNEEFTVMDDFIRKPTSRATGMTARTLRDGLLSGKLSDTVILTLVEKILNEVEVNTPQPTDDEPRFDGMEQVYRNTTKRLHEKRMKFCDEKLKNIDLNLVSGKAAHKVRRIIEKRMCQKVHNQRKGMGRGSREHYYMKRAVSYELRTIGLIDNGKLSRDSHTHWAREYNRIHEQLVLRPKRAYKSAEEAMSAIEEIKSKNESEARFLSVYRCCHCGLFHLGHNLRQRESITA